MSTPYTKTLEHCGLVPGSSHGIGFAEIIDNAVAGAPPELNMSFGQLVTAVAKWFRSHESYASHVQ